MDRFEWGNLFALSWIWVAAAAAVFMGLGARRRSILIRRLFEPDRAGEMAPPAGSRRFQKNLLLLAALFFSVLALMEPKYDYTWEKVKRRGVDIVIALDTSKSMLARDIPPSRFERSRLEIKNLVNQLEGDRIGLVVFTSTALTQCPLTLDYATFGRFLDEVEVGTLDRGGTSLSAAIDQAVLAFDTRYKKDRILILVTDGETHDTRLKDSLRKAEKANIRIYTVGLGSREGVPILLPSGDGEKRYVKDAEGNIVLTRLSEEPLKKAAFATEGGYLQAGAGGFSLEKLYRNKIEPLLGREMEARRKKRYMHRFYVPLALALLCLVLHTFLPERRS